MVGGYETKYTKALDVHYTFEEMYGNLMSNASYRLDPVLTTITVERSGETIDWMGERLGMPFSDNVIVGYGPLQMMHLVDGAGPAMRTAMEDTLAGTGVELLLETEGHGDPDERGWLREGREGRSRRGYPADLRGQRDHHDRRLCVQSGADRAP